MLDRGIGIAGIALGIIFGVLQYFLPQIPAWFSFAGIGIGILLLGLSVGLVFADRRNSVCKPADRATLRLHVYSDTRTPDRIAAENIFRWYYLKNMLVAVNPAGEQRRTVFTTLFVTFDPEVKITTLSVRSPDIQLPHHEVKDFNQKYAIIAFAGDIPEGTLEIAVTP